MHPRPRALLLALIFASPVAALAQECASPKAGWLFCDDFESGISSRWQNTSNFVRTTNTAGVRQGSGGLQITSHLNTDHGGSGLLDLTPTDTVHVRFYMKLSGNFGYMHHGVQIGARPAGYPIYYPFNAAGCRPSGSNYFMSGVEPTRTDPRTGTSYAAPGAWLFYTYYMDMSGWTNGGCDMCSECAQSHGSPACSNTCYYGAPYGATPPPQVQKDQWTCVEFKIQSNTVGQANGSQAMWIDGVKQGEWSGLRFRTDSNLKPNTLLLQNFADNASDYLSGQTQQTVWFDNVVVSSAQIGCLGSSPTPVDVPPAPPKNLNAR